MKKQLLVKTVPGKLLGFQSLSKMFCIVAIAAAVLRPSESEAQTEGPRHGCWDCVTEFHNYVNALNAWHKTNVRIPRIRRADYEFSVNYFTIGYLYGNPPRRSLSYIERWTQTITQSYAAGIAQKQWQIAQEKAFIKTSRQKRTRAGYEAKYGKNPRTPPPYTYEEWREMISGWISESEEKIRRLKNEIARLERGRDRIIADLPRQQIEHLRIVHEQYSGVPPTSEINANEAHYDVMFELADFLYDISAAMYAGNTFHQTPENPARRALSSLANLLRAFLDRHESFAPVTRATILRYVPQLDREMRYGR